MGAWDVRTINARYNDIFAHAHLVLGAELPGSPGQIAALASGLARNVGRVESIVDGAELFGKLLDEAKSLGLAIGLALLHAEVDLEG